MKVSHLISSINVISFLIFSKEVFIRTKGSGQCTANLCVHDLDTYIT